jgi:hypothetical protein
MKNLMYLLLLVVMGLTACKKSEEPAKPLPAGMRSVKVLENMDASNYTILHVEENGKDYWMAAPQFHTQKGETLYYMQAMEMKNFEVKSINRTFESIFFVQAISNSINGPAPQVSPHGSITSVKKENVSVEPLKDGYTIEKVYSMKEKIAGKTIKIKGKVTKYNGNIMGRNWIHIQDGTGSDDTADLLITSSEEASIGQALVFEGTVAVNKDFGAGYSYKVLLENGKILKNI